MQSKNNLEKKFNLKIPSPIESFNLLKNETKNVQFLIKRDDQIHPVLCGNKWRKLKYNLENIIQKETTQVISFGGAWSNHLHALGWSCKNLELELIAFIRGEANVTPSAMIQDLIDWGATINWLDRKQYRQKDEPNWLSVLQQKYPQAEILPEGGSNQFALAGITELGSEIQNQIEKVDYICAAVGSGGTLAGLIKHFSSTDTQIIGIPVVKGDAALKQRIEELLDNHSFKNWHLIAGYESGGYAKYDQTVADLITDYQQQRDILLEPIYTAKLLNAVEDLHHKRYFKKDSSVVVIHSGGLQGLRGDSKFDLNKFLKT
jgi:1-aminocyclopropane-1-carboxylate deaminase